MKRPTQADVARLAGVSRATVSYVINGHANGQVPISEETRQRVMEAVEELGYEPDARAQALRSGSTRTIGLIIPDIRNPHFWEYAEGVEQEASASGYHMLLSSTAPTNEYAEGVFRTLSHRRIDGLILLGDFTADSKETKNTLSDFLKRGLPIVELRDHHNVEYKVDCVLSDYQAATTEAMSYLISSGHLLPYQNSLHSAGLPVENELIVRCGPTIEDSYQAAAHLLGQKPRPTSLIAINDLLAAGVLRAASDLGLRVPEDLSVVGYDDIHLANYLIPRLTTVSKNVIEIGQEAVKLLLARIQEPDRPYQEIKYPPRLIIRESTGPAPVY
jgi:LacI family transcriptional regulator